MVNGLLIYRFIDMCDACTDYVTYIPNQPRGKQNWMEENKNKSNNLLAASVSPGCRRNRQRRNMYVHT